jgi:putative ABC transport system substrate-binding protein
MIPRRDFIMLLGGAAAWPLAARAQQSAMPVVGVVNGASADVSAERERAFLKGLGEGGYVGGQNVTVEYHRLDGRYDRAPALIAARTSAIRKQSPARNICQRRRDRRRRGSSPD